jgi:hypothetical protein
LVIDLPKDITGNVFDWGLTAKWSPDGSKVVTISGDRFLLGSQDYDMIVWDVATGEQLMATELVNSASPSAGEGVVTSVEHWSTGAAAFAPRTGGWRRSVATIGHHLGRLFLPEDLTLVGRERRQRRGLVTGQAAGDRQRAEHRRSGMGADTGLAVRLKQ